MEGEINRILIAWSGIVLSMCYCYVVRKRTQKGLKRSLCVLPVAIAFLLLPLWLQSVHAIGITAFFVAWLGNSKLLLLAFDRGPLVEVSCLNHFVAVGCLPIEISRKVKHGRNEKENPFQNRRIEEEPALKIAKKMLQSSNQNGKHESPGGKFEEKIKHNTNNGGIEENPIAKIAMKIRRRIHKSNLSCYAVKGLFLGITLHALDYTDYMHPLALLPMLSLHLYLSLEIFLKIFTTMARFLLNLELEPQFNEPYMASSLQDFWGRRWNLTATAILRSTVYEPMFPLLTSVMSPKHAQLSGVMATFVVSGLIHELIIYYIAREQPSWEMTGFFVLQGVFVVAEIVVKHKWLWGQRRRWLPKLIAVPLTLAVLITTASWLFFPPLLRCNAFVRGTQEFAAVKAFLNDLALSFNVV